MNVYEVDHVKYEYEFIWVPVHMIRTHPDRQRDLDEKRSEKLSAVFNPLFAQVPVLAANGDGTYYALDGQHEIGAQRHLGYTEVEAKVIYGLTPEMQAKAFLGLNDRRTVRALSKFKVAALAGEEPYRSLNELLTANGWEASPNDFAAVTTLAAVAKGKRQMEAAADVIETLTQAWGRQKEGAHQLIVAALGKIYNDREPDKRRLISALQKVSPATIRRNAEAGPQSVPVRYNFANEILAHYNKGLRSGRLHEFR